MFLAPLFDILGMVVLALITIGTQTLRTAWTNPADTLRYE